MPSTYPPVTVTFNPAIDETIFLDALQPGAVNRAIRSHRQAGGKGVNVSSLLAGFGIENTATGFLGSDNPAIFEQLFATRGIHDEFIRIKGETRTSLKIIAKQPAQTTDINFPGISPTPHDLTTIAERLAHLAKPGRWFVIAGSLPPDLPPHSFANILTTLKNHGARIAVDTSGTPLELAIHAGVDLIKPNQHELAALTGISPHDTRLLAASARELQQRHVPHIILSFGPDGALFLTPDGSINLTAAPVDVVSTVGAGDALLSGYLIGLLENSPLESRARLASGFAAHIVSDPTRTPPNRTTVASLATLPAIQH
ncbi:MAG: 1-phosphofructokinase family hexose kinase [Verrucomicrobiota bacterium JB025]|nr:1-phosphofructokinase family hexose kinase [Verrucomicrobiota bacterium JB025]